MAISPGEVLSPQRVLRIFRLDKMKTQKRIGTWSTRSFFAAKKLDKAIQEINRMRIDILGIAETRWHNSGTSRKIGTTFNYSGTTTLITETESALLYPKR